MNFPHVVPRPGLHLLFMLVWYSTSALKRRWRSVHRNGGFGRVEAERPSKREKGAQVIRLQSVLARFKGVRSAWGAEQACLLERTRVLVHAREPRARPTSGSVASSGEAEPRSTRKTVFHTIILQKEIMLHE
jgi:hypothetical protein